MKPLQLQYDYTSFKKLESMKEAEKAKASEDYGQNLANLLYEIGCNPYYIESVIMTTIYAGLNRKVVYHSPLHVLSILSFAQINSISLEDWELLTIYYHDAIYRPNSKKNETNSIQFMNSLLSDTGVKKDILTQASFGIQATAMHLDTHVASDCEKLLDLDLHGFSFPYEKYIINSENIHDEYVNSDPAFNGITEQEFVSGRIKFLEALLNKGFIFRTETFKTNWESTAKINISTEIELLKKF